MPNSFTSPRQCRVDDAEAPDLMVSAFGEVDTPLAQGVFQPETDRLVLNSGEEVADYYKRTLGVPHFKPLDKSVFKTPPTGWLTWMYYGRDVTPEEVLANAKWIADNLKEYGVDVILIDDGWQGGGRDWEGLRDSFAKGMKWLADEIRKLGLVPGLWICPHGQERKELLKPDGGFIECKTFGGPFSVDPTDPKGRDYLRGLMRRLTEEWGYKFLKFDGVAGGEGYGILDGYCRERGRLSDTSCSGEEAFRRLLDVIAESVGPEVFIGGCGIHCLPAVGLCHGMRTGGDTDAEWYGFLRAVTATMDGYFLHDVALYADPDCCLLRSPLSVEMAKAWATLYGLTGQMLMLDDRMSDLGPTRVGVMKKILPAAGIHPFDLFKAKRHKSTFDLKVNHLGRRYDIVAVFNYDEGRQEVKRVDFAALGLRPGARHHVYDFWNDDYLGVHDLGLFLEVPPAACRVVTLCEEGEAPVLLSTSRHILQGWPDLLELDASSASISGKSQLIKGEPYTLVFGLPNNGVETFLLESVDVEGCVSPSTRQERGVARVSWTPGASGAFSWRASFKRVPMPMPIPIASYPYMMGATDLDPWTVEIFWLSFGSPCGFSVKMDGKDMGHVFGTRFRMGGLEHGSRHEFEVVVADLDGRKGARSGKISVTVGESLPAELPLSSLRWESASAGGACSVKRDRNAIGVSLRCGGRRFLRGIGAFPDSSVEYDLKGLFGRLKGSFGIEDQNGITDGTPDHESGQAVFSIKGDGRELLPPTSMIHGQAPRPFDIDIRGVGVLVLRVEKPKGASVNKAPHANWLDMELSF